MIKKAIITAALVATITSPATATKAAYKPIRKANAVFITETELKTTDGHKWSISKEYKPGTKARVTFQTNGTRNKKDDIIIRIRKRSK